MSALWRSDTESHHCDINKGPIILAACAAMTGLACMVLVARIYTRGWMTHSTDRDDYTMWVAVVRMGLVQVLFRRLIMAGFVCYCFCSLNPSNPERCWEIWKLPGPGRPSAQSDATIHFPTTLCLVYFACKGLNCLLPTPIYAIECLQPFLMEPHGFLYRYRIHIFCD